MNRYIIVIPAKNRSFLLKCDEGDGMKSETLQKLVSGYVETVPAALDATWAREEADRLVLLGGGAIERLHGFWFRPDFTRWAENWYFNENVLLLLWLALVAAAALCALRALLRRREA